MRIIGGVYRGRTINPPATFKARPTTDYAKEGLFNTLINQYDLSEISVLDLFSGSGSISYEFASRGCRDIIAVEMNNIHAGFIKKTIADLKIEGIQIVRHNVFDFLKICNRGFDIIFADPPYDIKGLETIPEKIFAEKILNENGLLILEHPSTFDFQKDPRFTKEKSYGEVHFSFFTS